MNVQSHALLKASSAVNATRVSLPSRYHLLYYPNSLQWGTFPRTVPPVEATLAATVARKGTRAKNVTNPGTQQMSHAATAMRWDISVKIAPSLVTTAKSSVPIVIKVCRPPSYDCIELRLADNKTVGHTKVRCKEPIKAIDDGGFGAGGDTGGFDAPAGGDDFAAPAAGGGDEWAAGGATDNWGTTSPAVTGGGGGGGQDGW